jgi:hypothetical protein
MASEVGVSLHTVSKIAAGPRQQSVFCFRVQRDSA